MQMFLSLAGIIICLLILAFSGKYLIQVSIKFARSIGVSDIIIGTTLVALMTGAPTLLVSLIAFRSGNTDIALGNLIGTNYVNLGLALGIPAFMTTIVIKQEVFEKEIPLYFALIALFTSLVIDKSIDMRDGIILLGFTIISWFILIQYAFSHKGPKTDEAFKQVVGDKNNESNTSNLLKQVFGIISLLIILLIASFGISFLTPIFSFYSGINSYLLSLTLVGIGTSIPTVIAGINAARQGNNDLVVGNVFGGNILNIGLGVGILGVLGTINITENITNDIVFVNLYGAVIVLLILAEMRLLGKNKTLSRLSGLLMITIYLVYTGVILIKGI